MRRSVPSLVIRTRGEFCLLFFELLGFGVCSGAFFISEGRGVPESAEGGEERPETGKRRPERARKDASQLAGFFFQSFKFFARGVLVFTEGGFWSEKK
jgi:hypothetical protein